MSVPGNTNEPSPYEKQPPQPAEPGSYAAPPQQGYGQPQQGYGQPQPGAAPPQPSYGQPAYGQPQPGQPVGGYQQAPVSDSDERNWGMLAHLGGIVVGFVAGLVVFLIYKDRSAFLRSQGAEALNFQITIGVAVFALTILTFILAFATGGLLGFLNLGFLAWVLGLVFQIIAGLAAKEHRDYRYPFAIRLVK